jgi:hypothetical protein
MPVIPVSAAIAHQTEAAIDEEKTSDHSAPTVLPFELM